MLTSGLGLTPRPVVPHSAKPGHPAHLGMTLFEDHVYWTDWETKSINRAHKTTGANKTLLISTHGPWTYKSSTPCASLVIAGWGLSLASGQPGMRALG